MRSRSWIGKFVFVAASLTLAGATLHAETHSGGGIGPDGRPIAPGASQAKLFQLVNACVAGRGGGLGSGIGAAVNQPPSVGSPDLSGGLFSPPAVVSQAAAAGGDVSRGNAIFNARCLNCHGPGKVQAGKNATGPTGVARVQSGSMPPGGGLSEQEKRDVAAFIASRNGG